MWTNFITGKSVWEIWDFGIKYRLSQQTEHDVDFSLSVMG